MYKNSYEKRRILFSSHIRDFLEDCAETQYGEKNRIESYYDNELSLKSVRQKNSELGRSKMLTRCYHDLRKILARFL